MDKSRLCDQDVVETVRAALEERGVLVFPQIHVADAEQLAFTDKLWRARTKGMGLYMALAARYVTEFEAKWTVDRMPPEPLMGNADFQSMADLANAVNVVKGMRWIPVGPRLLTEMTTAAVVPLAPLVLFEYPIAELTQKFFTRLVGL